MLQCASIQGMLASPTSRIAGFDSGLCPLGIYVHRSGHRPFLLVLGQHNLPGVAPSRNVVSITTLMSVKGAVFPKPSIDSLPDFGNNKVRYGDVQIKDLILVRDPLIIRRRVAFQPGQRGYHRRRGTSNLFPRITLPVKLGILRLESLSDEATPVLSPTPLFRDTEVRLIDSA